MPPFHSAPAAETWTHREPGPTHPGPAARHRPLCSRSLPLGALGALALQRALTWGTARTKAPLPSPCPERSNHGRFSEEQGPGGQTESCRTKGWEWGRKGRPMKGKWALTGCPPASPSGSRGRSGPVTQWEERTACDHPHQAGNEDDPGAAVFAFLFPCPTSLTSLAWFQRSCSRGFGGNWGRLNLK